MKVDKIKQVLKKIIEMEHEKNNIYVLKDKLNEFIDIIFNTED